MGVARKANLKRSGVDDTMQWTNNTGSPVAAGDIVLIETNTVAIVPQQNIASGATGLVLRKGDFESYNEGAVASVDAGDPIYYTPSTLSFSATGNVGGSAPPYKIGIFTAPVAADGTNPSDATFLSNTALNFAINAG